MGSQAVDTPTEFKLYIIQVRVMYCCGTCTAVLIVCCAGVGAVQGWLDMSAPHSVMYGMQGVHRER